MFDLWAQILCLTHFFQVGDALKFICYQLKKNTSHTRICPPKNMIEHVVVLTHIHACDFQTTLVNPLPKNPDF